MENDKKCFVAGCKLFGHSFSSRSTLLRHNRNAHNDKFVPKYKRKWECSKCNRVLSTKRNLDRHMKKPCHVKVKAITCHKCDKTLSSEYFPQHVCRKPKKFQCYQCKKQLYSIRKVASHLKRHRGVCETSFPTIEALLEHGTQAPCASACAVLVSQISLLLRKLRPADDDLQSRLFGDIQELLLSPEEDCNGIGMAMFIAYQCLLRTKKYIDGISTTLYTLREEHVRIVRNCLHIQCPYTVGYIFNQEIFLPPEILDKMRNVLQSHTGHIFERYRHIINWYWRLYYKKDAVFGRQFAISAKLTASVSQETAGTAETRREAIQLIKSHLQQISKYMCHKSARGQQYDSMTKHSILNDAYETLISYLIGNINDISNLVAAPPLQITLFGKSASYAFCIWKGPKPFKLDGHVSEKDEIFNDLHKKKTGSKSGDRMWRMPLFKHYTSQMTDHSGYDLNNLGKGAGGGSCTAAAFLREFVPKDTPWIHVDMAGVMGNCTDQQYTGTKGMTGRPMRTLFEFVCLEAGLYQN